MLHRFWTALTGWHAYQIKERDSYRAYFFTRPEEEEYHQAPHFYLEIPHEPRLELAANLSVGGSESDFSGHLALFYRVFFGAEHLLPREWRERLLRLTRHGLKYGGYSRSFRLELRNDRDTDALWICLDLWRNDSCTSWDDNKKWPWQGNGWHFMVDLKDLLLGRTKHLRLPNEVEARNLWINMPEGRYPARMIVTRELWLRERILSVFRRWPKVDELLGPEFLYRAHVVIPGGIPEPGKGENSWDLDDEATQEITLAAEPSFPDRHAVSRKVCDLVMRRRHNYGSGFGWKPDAGWPSCVVPYGEERDFPAELERINGEVR
jgi:hypothetical protein